MLARHEVDPQQGIPVEAGGPDYDRLSFTAPDPRKGEG